MKPGLVSVVMPTYNQSEYLPQAVNSVLRQTYGDLEIIVIDDGSTDDTEKVVSSIKDERIRYIRTVNEGNYFARNAGIRESAGEYIAFLDSDDIWLEDKIKMQVDILRGHEDIGLCCTDHYVFFDDMVENVYIDKLHGFSEDLLSHEAFMEKMLRENIIITSSVMVRRSCFEHLDAFDTKYQNAMDYDMWLRLMLNYGARYVKDRCLLKRMHKSNISRNRIDSYKALLYIFRKANSSMDNVKFSERVYKRLIKERIQRSLYELGLEYLNAKNYNDAFKCLSDSRYVKKNRFRYFAMFVARFHMRFLIRG